MKFCQVQRGVHTFEVGQPLTKSQFQDILSCGYACGRVIPRDKGHTKSYTLLSKEKDVRGIRIVLHHVPKKRIYRVSVQIEPCRVLGSQEGTALYVPSKRSYAALGVSCDQYLSGWSIPGSIEDMKISRCDVTSNLIFERQDYVDAYLRILKKSCRIKGYEVGGFDIKEKKAKDTKRANEHSFSVQCKTATFLCYDKIDQLKMTGRSSAEHEHGAMLRLEAQLKRTVLKRRLSGGMDTNYDALHTAADQSEEILSGYLKQLFPCGGQHLKYRQAEQMVQAVKKTSMREKLLYLLRKTSDSANLSNAQEKLEQKYGLSAKQIASVVDAFKKLALSPITLPNTGEIEGLPALIDLLD